MALSSPPRRPDSQFGFMPEIMKQAARGQFLGVPDHAVCASCASCRRRSRANLRQAKIEFECGRSTLGIDLDRVAHQHAEAGQFVGRLV